MSIKIQEHFRFGPGWYCQREISVLVMQYYFVVRSVLRGKPCLRRCLTRCRHCRIFFLTYPCNAGRKDLGCPFGCRDAHRKQGSTKRSVDYYRTPEGKLKKQAQNGKRSMVEPTATLSFEPQTGGQPQACRFDAQMVSYLRMITSLIEGRRVSEIEILEMLERAVRQHSMVRRRRIDYVLRYLNKNAP